MADSVKRNIYISINGKEVVNSMGGIQKAISETSKSIRNLNKNDADYQQKLREHKQQLASLREEYARTKNEINGIPSVFQKIKTSLGDVASGMLAAFSIGAVVGMFGSQIKKAMQIVIEFDQAQANLAGILETTKIGVARLTADALKYGATTSFTASQVSVLQLELAKLGKTQDEIRGMTKGVIDAAVAMEAELGPAAELIGGQLNSFGESASAAGKYADIMSNSTNVSATSFESLATALPKVSAVAARNNVSFEKLNATLGVLADNNIAAESTGTSFRNILLTAAKAGKDYEVLLREVANSTDATKKATELFGKENATVAVILSQSFEKVREQTELLENSAGSAAKLAEQRLDSIKGSATLFQSAWEGMILGIEKGDGIFSKMTRRVIDLGTEIIGLISPTKQLSEEIFEEQVQLNSLVDRITDANTSNEEREKLLKQLKSEYPSFINMIDDETFSNKSLQDALSKVNDQYQKRILLQAQIEKADSYMASRDNVEKNKAQVQMALYEKLQKAKVELGSSTAIEWSNLEKSAKSIISEMVAAGKNTGAMTVAGAIRSDLKNLQLLGASSETLNESYKQQLAITEDIKNETGLVSEAERQRMKDYNMSLDELIVKATKLGGIEGKDFFALNAESITRYLKKMQAVEKTPTKDGDDKEAKKAEKLAARKKELFEKGEKEIDELILKSIQGREGYLLKGFAKEIRAVENKYAQDLLKYKDHSARLAEIEMSRDAEIAEMKRIKANEYALEIFEIEKQIDTEKELYRLDKLSESATTENDRALVLLEKAKFVADLEIQSEMEKELAKVEAVENAEELKQAIREKYANRQAQNDNNFAQAEKGLRTNQVDWTRITEKQKLDIITGALNSAAEAFNQGSAAWKAIKIAETIITTYQSATNSYNALSGIPIVGPALGGVAAGLAVISGLKNIQKISNTEMQKMPTYFYGGFTGNGKPSLGGDKYGAFTGMTHADEWVMPAFMTQSPRYAPTLQWLENERQMGTAPSTPPASANHNSSNNDAVMFALTGAINQLSEIMADGIVARTAIGYEEIKKINDLNKDLERSSNNTSL